jgi:hypothetical protein
MHISCRVGSYAEDYVATYVGDGRAATRLQKVVGWAYKQLQPYRENHRKAIEEFVGRNWSYADNPTERGTAGPMARPINMLALAVTVFVQQLAAQIPSVLVTTPVKELKPTAHDLSILVPYIMRRIHFGETMRMRVQDALFALSVVKVGVSTEGLPDSDVLGRVMGEVFVDRVSIDDLIVDMRASHWRKAQFVGNRYKVPLDDFMELKDVSDAHKEQVRARADESNATREARANDLGRGSKDDVHDSTLYPMVELADIYLPRDNLIVTRVAGDGPGLTEREWDGYEGGPYRKLSFRDVQDNVMPLPPVASWRDVANIVNTLVVKLSQQAERQKSLTLYRKSSEADAERIKNAKDGTMVGLDGSPANVVPHTSGGADPNTMATYLQLRGDASWFMGNLDIMGGLSAMAPTATQDKLLDENASKQIEDTREKLKGEFIDYNFKITPYSTAFVSPQAQLAMVRQYLSEMVFPLQAQFEAQGAFIDLQALTEMVADLAQIERIRDIVKFGETSIGGLQQGNGPPVTRRENVRTNRSAPTRPAKDQAVATMMMGKNPLPGQAAGVGR